MIKNTVDQLIFAKHINDQIIQNTMADASGTYLIVQYALKQLGLACVITPVQVQNQAGEVVAHDWLKLVIVEPEIITERMVEAKACVTGVIATYQIALFSMTVLDKHIDKQINQKLN